LTGGQRHERTQLLALLDAIRVSRPGGHGRPWKRPAHLLADEGGVATKSALPEFVSKHDHAIATTFLVEIPLPPNVSLVKTRQPAFVSN